MNIRRYLRLFNNKKSPARISLNYDVAINYDMFAVYIADPNTGEEYVFESYENEQLKVRKRNKVTGEFDSTVNINPDELTEHSFSGVYFYKGHQAEFKNLLQLNIWEIWKFKRNAKKSNKSDAREKFLFRKQQQAIKESMDILDAVIELHLQHGDARGVNIISVMDKVHSRLWLHHQGKERMKREMSLWLNGFANSGDLKKMDDYNYLPEGKAVMTRKNYLDESTRYRETTTIQRGMFWAALFSAIAACASAAPVLKSLFKWLHHLV